MDSTADTKPDRSLPASYAHVPRAILWLVPGGEVEVGGRTVAVEPFYLGKWPVTNEQFEAFDPGYERSPRSPRNRDLAVGVSFDQADAYCRWYAEVSRKPMRLPTRIEWVYACRGCSAADEAPTWAVTASDLDRTCWHAGNSGDRVRPPERRAANDFGLHGMLGSVWEWMARDDDGGGEQRLRVLCGGSFRSEASELRAALIDGLAGGLLVRREATDYAAGDTGFRVARSFRIRQSRRTGPGYRATSLSAVRRVIPSA